MSNWQELKAFIAQHHQVQERGPSVFLVFVETTAGRSQTLQFLEFPHFAKVMSPIAQAGEVALDKLLLRTPLFGVGTSGNGVYGLVHAVSFAAINYETVLADLYLLAVTADELEQMILGTDDW